MDDQTPRATTDDGADDREAPRRILVADDEHLVGRHTTSALKTLGFEVVGPAKNGAEAVKLAEREQPDMAILDIRMPEMDGLAAARELWQRFGTPVIILSAFSNERYLDQARKTGVFGYLIKPAMMDDLRVAIGVAWSRYRDSRD